MITRSPIKPTKPFSGLSSKRAPTPLRSAPTATATTSDVSSSTATGSTATPHEAMVASQLAHINDLVHSNRSLEQTIKKLNEDLSKSAADILALTTERKTWEGDRKAWTSERQKWMDERKTWAQGCDTMQACHRIQQYRVACALHDERVAVLRMQDAARRAQLQRLQRDYKITMFQAREAELEAQIVEVEELRDEATEVRDYYDKSTQALKARCAALADQVKSKTTEIQAVRRQCEQVEEDLRRLREAHADATATSTASSSKLTRLTTERDALEAQATSLKRSLELAQDETTQLRTQLTNWQHLKKGEDADAEKVRKKNIALEQELREATKRISEFETNAGDIDALQTKLQKQKDRVERLKQCMEEWKTEAEEQKTARGSAETQLGSAQAQIITLEQRVTELQTQLPTASKPKSSSRKAAPPPQPAQSDEELEDMFPSPSTSSERTKVKAKPNKPASTSKPSTSRPANASAKPQSSPRPVKRLVPTPESRDSDIEILEAPPAPLFAPEQNSKVKGKQRAERDGGHRSDNEMEEVQKEKKKTKKKGIEKETETREPTKAKVGRPKKISPSDGVDETHSKAKEKTNSKKRASPDPPKKSKGKPSQPKEDSEDAAAVDADADSAPKKKKRKINLFGGSQPSTFDWNSLTQPGQDLGIPTRLSPMKETDIVPRRLGRASKG